MFEQPYKYLHMCLHIHTHTHTHTKCKHMSVIPFFNDDEQTNVRFEDKILSREFKEICLICLKNKYISF